MSVLRSMDGRFAKRCLREKLIDFLTVDEAASDTTESSVDPEAAIPHGYDTEGLLAFAHEVVLRDDLRERDEYDDVLALTAQAHALNDRVDVANDLFERGLARASTNHTRALFHFHVGHHIHQRNRDFAAARESLVAAHRFSERSRRLRSITLLALGSVEIALGAYDAAVEALVAARDLHVRDLEPLALLRLANVYRHRGDLREAGRVNRESRQLFDQHRDWLGVNVSDAYFGLLKLEEGEHGMARETFERVVASELQVLDVTRLGRTYNNLSIACLRMRDFEAARDAIVEAIHYNQRFDRPAQLAGNYHNLGRCLARLADFDASFAAFDRSVGYSRAMGDCGFEFETLTDVLNIVSDHHVRVDVVPAVLARCYDLLQLYADRLSHKRVVEFGQMTQRLLSRHVRSPIRFPAGAADLPLTNEPGQAAMSLLLPPERSRDYSVQLASRIGTGPGGHSMPPRSDLSQFLLLYAGDYFKSGHYTREFGLTQERAKRHLRWLCGRRVIERFGSRKASRYALAFHR